MFNPNREGCKTSYFLADVEIFWLEIFNFEVVNGGLPLRLNMNFPLLRLEMLFSFWGGKWSILRLEMFYSEVKNALFWRWKCFILWLEMVGCASPAICMLLSSSLIANSCWVELHSKLLLLVIMILGNASIMFRKKYIKHCKKKNVTIFSITAMKILM